MCFNIVYIDDEPDICQMFSDNFSVSGEIEIKTFVDPELALKEIEANRPDLVFLDHRLPNTIGYEVALRIKAKVPLVLITGDLDMNLQLPFIKLFQKPFDFVEMEAFIYSYVHKNPNPK